MVPPALFFTQRTTPGLDPHWLVGALGTAFPSGKAHAAVVPPPVLGTLKAKKAVPPLVNFPDESPPLATVGVANTISLPKTSTFVSFSANA